MSAEQTAPAARWQGPSTVSSDGITSSELRRAAWAASLGSALEYYDFALYNLCSALVFGPLFFPSSDPILGLIGSFGTYFLGFAARPLGGILFGIAGDRLGRKFVLTATILLMGSASTLMGVLPTYATAGIWAPIALVALRLLQGLGAGAEQAGAAVLMAEYAPPARRGYFAALPFIGVQLGSAMAVLIYFLLLNRDGDIGHSYAWRIPFLLSAFIIGVAVWIRLRLKESPSFAKLEKRKEIDPRPLANLLRHSRRPLLLVIGLRFAEGSGSAIYQTLAISYIVTVTGQSGSIGALSLLLGAASGAIMVLLAGILSDRFGRVTMYRIYAVAQLLLAVPIWWALHLGDKIISIAAIVIALLPLWGMFGTQAALLPELFGARHRYVGVATGREFSAMIAGGTAPLIGAAIIAQMARHGDAAGAWAPIALYLVAMTLITIVATFFTPETRGRPLDDLRDA